MDAFRIGVMSPSGSAGQGVLPDTMAGSLPPLPGVVVTLLRGSPADLVAVLLAVRPRPPTLGALLVTEGCSACLAYAVNRCAFHVPTVRLELTDS